MHFKNIKIYFSILLITLASNCYSQIRPSLQLSFGLAFPGKKFAGELVAVNDSGISFINPDFIKTNYATSTGVSISGTLRFPLERKGIFSAVFTGSYTFFNAFRRNYLGTTVENNLVVPVTFDNRFSTSSAGLGIEASPLAESKISPYVNASFTFNILSMTLSKNDFVSVIFNDAFRMGVLFNAGVNIKLSTEYSLTAGGSYHLSNLFFKSHKESYGDRIEFNRENVSINDEGGTYYSNLNDPDFIPSPVNGSDKNAAWWNFNIGLNIVLGKSVKK